jgi:tripeptide aminopeptidase
MNTQLLRNLYTTHSPSLQETKISALVRGELDTMKIKYDVDKLGQIWKINPGKPLMIAHMDQVQKTACVKVMTFKNSIYGFDDKGKLSGLGADDKNGIYIILNMIEKFRDDMSFIFSVGEEIGGRLYHVLDNINLTPEIAPYGLIFDRKGSSDIIGSSNNYCCDDLEKAVEVLSGNMKYKASYGTFSDCDELAKWIPCVNLSCGYYDAHSENEHTKVGDLFRAVQLAEVLLGSLPRKGSPFEIADQFETVGSEWMKEFYSTKGTKAGYVSYGSTKKKEKEVVGDDWGIDECMISIEEDGIYFYDGGTGEETFIGEEAGDAVGSWNLESGLMLEVNRLGRKGIQASINGTSIHVEECYGLRLDEDEEVV